MQIQQLMYFVTVAEQGSINKAAEKLFITQPNLSKAISNLENEVKARVFNRTNKGVVLTEEGKKLYQYARTILNQMELIHGLSQRERPRILSVAAYPIITMGRLVCQFYNAHRHPGQPGSQDNVEIRLVEQPFVLRQRPEIFKDHRIVIHLIGAAVGGPGYGHGSQQLRKPNQQGLAAGAVGNVLRPGDKIGQPVADGKGQQGAGSLPQIAE